MQVKRVPKILRPQPQRLSKLLSNLSICSNSQFKYWIRNNRISHGSQTYRQPPSASSLVDPRHVRINERPLPVIPPLHIAFHKPKGFLSSNKSDRLRDHKTIFDLMPPIFSKLNPPLSIAGRLDKSASGLMILSQEGQLVNRIISPLTKRKETPLILEKVFDLSKLEQLSKANKDPRSKDIKSEDSKNQDVKRQACLNDQEEEEEEEDTQIEPSLGHHSEEAKARLADFNIALPKTYHIVVRDPLLPDQIDLIQSGKIKLDGKQCLPTTLTVLGNQNTTAQIILNQGIHRQIKRMVKAAGNEVEEIHRIQIGPVKLGDLPEGEFRLLSAQELIDLWNTGEAEKTTLPKNPPKKKVPLWKEKKLQKQRAEQEKLEKAQSVLERIENQTKDKEERQKKAQALKNLDLALDEAIQPPKKKSAFDNPFDIKDLDMESTIEDFDEEWKDD